MKRLVVIALLVAFFALSCAAGDKAKRYEQLIYINCFAPNCNVKVDIVTSVDADIKKSADAKADISPTLDIAP